MKNIHSFIKSNCGIGGISSVSRRFLVLFITLLSLEVGQMWAATWTFSGGTMYFDNRNTQWNDVYIYLVIGKDNYSSTYRMTPLAGGGLYKCDLPTSGWSDATYMAVIGSGSSFGSGAWGSSNLSTASHYTSAYISGHSGNGSYIFTPSTSSNGCSLTRTSFSSGYFKR